MHDDTVTLFIATGCAHCAALMELLGKRVKSGALAKLEIINISSAPEVARQNRLRSVPVTRIGALEFEGVLDAAELDKWLGLAGTDAAVTEYMEFMLSTGKLHRVQSILKEHPQWLPHLVSLLRKAALPMQVRVGIVALMEETAAELVTDEVIDHLRAIIEDGERHLQTDALHILSLYQDPAITHIMQQQLDNPDEEMREIAAEYMAKL